MKRGTADTREGEMKPFREAHARIRERTALEPRVAVVLGTGLGGLGESIEIEEAIPYTDIPHFSHSTVETHAGRLLFGHLDEVPVVAMEGRVHRYEGYSLQEVVFPIRVMRLLGAKVLVVSGACGGMDARMKAGDLVLLDDQINLMGDSPLVGPNLDEFGPRFPDMSEPFDGELRELAFQAALERGIRLHPGVYAAVVGPALETRAEYRMLRRLGADVVGMSIVPEVLAARHMEMRVLGMTVVTNVCLPDALEAADVAEILRTARNAEPRLTALIRDVVKEL